MPAMLTLGLVISTVAKNQFVACQVALIVGFLPAFELSDPHAGPQVTLVDLLSHRVGLPHNSLDYLLERGDPYPLLVYKLREVEMACPVGDCYGYQNISYALFGDITYAATGDFYEHEVARRIFGPLESMDATMAAVEAGDVSARVGQVPGRDEIARLAEHFDALLDTLHERNAELSRLNTELDFKVIERTRELALALEDLRAAQKQLVRSEKLAAIGQLAAGVAHEINNPIAVMQGNLDLLREELGEAAAPVGNELRLLDEQIHRIRVIVTKLLQFARPDEFAGYVETVDVNTAVADCLVLVRHELKKGDIEVVQELRATAPVRINRNELQQVLINLAVNAVHAMSDGGRLTFITQDWEGKGVRIGVRDTGTGIAPEHLARVFDPFFTTKKTQGTGLGLSISLALIERYGGTISVDSRAGEGTEFSVFLLAEPVFREREGLDTMANT